MLPLLVFSVLSIQLGIDIARCHDCPSYLPASVFETRACTSEVLSIERICRSFHIQRWVQLSFDVDNMQAKGNSELQRLELVMPIKGELPEMSCVVSVNWGTSDGRYSGCALLDGECSGELTGLGFNYSVDNNGYGIAKGRIHNNKLLLEVPLVNPGEKAEIRFWECGDPVTYNINIQLNVGTSFFEGRIPVSTLMAKVKLRWAR